METLEKKFMPIYEIIMSKRAERDKAFFKKNAPKDYKKLISLIDELETHPRTGTGRPEPLTNVENGWSRRINERDRLEYEIHDRTVIVNVLSARGHYDDH